MESLNPPGSLFFAWKEKCIRLLADPKTGYFIVFLVIVCRALQLIYLFNSRNDMTFQILGAQYLLDGHGLSAAEISLADISETIYHPLNQWPPGFSILFIPFYLAFGKDYILAALAIGIVFAILLIFAGRAILKVLGVPSHLINLFTLLSGFFGYYFYTKPCTDAEGITFFVIAIYYTLLLLKGRGNTVWNLLLVIFCLLFSGFIKYLYIPVTFVIPVFLFYKGVISKKRVLKKNSLIIFSTLLFVYMSFFIYQKYAVGSIGYITQPERGIYPENLKEIFPFIVGSFIKTESLDLFGFREPLLGLFQVISLGVFIILIYYVFQRMSRRESTIQSPIADFFSLSVLLTMIIVTVLSYLSLTVAKEYGTWTYVEEPRYYGLVTVLIHIAVFALYPAGLSWKNKILKFLFPALVLFMVPEMIRGVIFATHRIQRIQKETYGWQYELGFQKETEAVVKKIRQRNSNNIVIAGSSDWMTLRASLYSRLPVFKDIGKLNSISALNTSKPVTLLAIIRNDHLAGLAPFINTPGTRFEDNKTGYSFYTYQLEPH